MANEIKLEVYTIKVREKHKKKKQFLALESIPGSTDFLNFFQKYIDSFDQQLELDEDKRKTLKLDSTKLSLQTDMRTISGVIESGDYGFSGKGVNIKTGKESYTRTKEDTEIKPFYFLIYLPKKKKVGFILLQRIGIYGIQNIFKTHLSTFFDNKYPDLKLDFAQFVSKELAETFVDKGAIQNMSLVSNKLPADIASKMGLDGLEKSVKSIELKIMAKGRLPINATLSKFMKNPNTSFFEVEEIRDLGFDEESRIKVKSRFNGNTRTIDLSASGKIRPYYDIDNDVQKDSDGHPQFSSIDGIAKKLIKELVNF